MTTSQSHGNSFEDLVRNCGRFPGSSADRPGATALFDIPARFDATLGLPTSVKTSQNGGSIGLADARRFWTIDYSFRMIVGPWRQIDSRQKVISEIHEFVVQPATLAALRGSLTLDEVAAFHDAICGFPRGAHFAARAHAVRRHLDLASRRGHVILNPKIDSGRQRRLQCSVPLTALTSVVAADGHTVYRERLGDLGLPIILTSSSRIFRDREI